MKPQRLRGATTMARWPSAAVGADQHDPPHRPAADALDAGEQLHLPRAAAAAVVPHAANGKADVIASWSAWEASGLSFQVRPGAGSQALSPGRRDLWRRRVSLGQCVAPLLGLARLPPPTAISNNDPEVCTNSLQRRFVCGRSMLPE